MLLDNSGLPSDILLKVKINKCYPVNNTVSCRHHSDFKNNHIDISSSSTKKVDLKVSQYLFKWYRYILIIESRTNCWPISTQDRVKPYFAILAYLINKSYFELWENWHIQCLCYQLFWKVPLLLISFWHTKEYFLGDWYKRICRLAK